MKLIIQIPCYNEEETLPLVFEKMPQTVEGIDTVEFLVIDDASTDRTVDVARSLGVHHIVRIRGENRRWLGRAFKVGIDHALELGADIVVNTDGDNQYPAERIPDLVAPILNGTSHIVIGDRKPGALREFSGTKRFLQRLGNRLVSFCVHVPVPDAVSGFRAYSREALLKIHVVTHYTYTVDTLIQAYNKGIPVAWIPIEPNEKTRESRLIPSLFSKVRKSGVNILRMTTIYSPFKTFLVFAVLFAVPGLLAIGRFLFFFFFVPERATGLIQSVVLGGVCLLIAVQMIVLGLLGDLLSVNRTLVEEALSRIRSLELSGEKPADNTAIVEKRVEGMEPAERTDAE